MQPDPDDTIWLDQAGDCSLAELAAFSGLSEIELRDLVDYGAISPLDPASARPRFRFGCVTIVRSAFRLRRDFDLDPPALAFALSLLERMRALEAEVCELRALLPRRAPD